MNGQTLAASRIVTGRCGGQFDVVTCNYDFPSNKGSTEIYRHGDATPVLSLPWMATDEEIIAALWAYKAGFQHGTDYGIDKAIADIHRALRIKE